MKKLNWFLFGGICMVVACAPSENLVANLPSSAGKYARFSFKASEDSVRVALSNSLESGTGSFIPTGISPNRKVISSSWTKVGGQTDRVFFELNGNETLVVVNVYTVPTPPLASDLLVKSLKQVGNEVQTTLSLTSYILEPLR